ncbi:hypothetical protein LTR08_005890 [Meristemomyces frigidus]|nr:hypothetical protein LTR08_005890 [Meristemomyces frigidus]
MNDGVDIKTRFEALSRGAYFEVLLPRSSDFDAVALLRDASPEELAKAPTRRNLFFDERARTQLVLKTSTDEDEVRSLLPSLEVVLAAHATDGAPQGPGSASPSGEYDLTSVTIAAAESAEILVVGDQTYVVWESAVHIPWPRARLQRPAIYFTANLTICAPIRGTSSESVEDYLAPYEPIPANVLGPLNFDPAFRNKKLYLSEDRITKIAPVGARVTLKDHVVKPVRGASKRAFPTMPALYTRLNFTALPDGAVASLHIETSQVIAGVFDLNCIRVSAEKAVAHAKAVDVERENRKDHTLTEPKAHSTIQSLSDFTCPMQMQAGDETILIYPLKLKSSDSIPATVHVAIQAVATLEQGSQINLDIHWDSQVTLPQNALVATHTWSKLPGVSTSSEIRLSTQGVPKPVSLGGDAQSSTDADGGVKLFFTAPRAAFRGLDFQLKVKCINNSGRSRHFVVRPRYRGKARTTQSEAHSTLKSDDVADIFSARLPEKQKAPDVFCDTPEVLLGPLAPGACFETEVNYHVLAVGVLDMGGVTIVDLDTSRTLDVIDLPDIVALEAPERTTPYTSRGTFSGRDDKITEQMKAAAAQWRKDAAKWITDEEDVRSVGHESPH